MTATTTAITCAGLWHNGAYNGGCPHPPTFDDGAGHMFCDWHHGIEHRRLANQTGTVFEPLRAPAVPLESVLETVTETTVELDITTTLVDEDHRWASIRGWAFGIYDRPMPYQGVRIRVELDAAAIAELQNRWVYDHYYLGLLLRLLNGEEETVDAGT
jgi:hypothetical protein